MNPLEFQSAQQIALIPDDHPVGAGELWFEQDFQPTRSAGLCRIMLVISAALIIEAVPSTGAPLLLLNGKATAASVATGALYRLDPERSWNLRALGGAITVHFANVQELLGVSSMDLISSTVFSQFSPSPSPF